MSENKKRICFVEMMGEPGSYDASVYDHFDDKDREGEWFVRRFGDIGEFEIATCNVCIDEPLPDPSTLDGLVLAGSYNSVHDDRPWQRRMLDWLPTVREQCVPVLAICGSHQLLSHALGSRVHPLSDGPYAGTFPVSLTEAGRASPLMESIADNAPFQFANTEHVVDVPPGCTLLASSGPVGVAALDFGEHCYSTQFHPEGTHETLSTVWRYKQPELMDRYYPEETGYQLVRNFLQLVVSVRV